MMVSDNQTRGTKGVFLTCTENQPMWDLYTLPGLIRYIPEEREQPVK